MISGEIPGVVENKYHQLCIDNSNAFFGCV